MDFDLRQWLLILGPVFIFGVLLHGYLRMRAGQNNIRMKLDKGFLSQPGEQADPNDLNMFKAELPNGGARVINGLDDESDDVPVLRESVELPRSVAAPIDERANERINARADESVHESPIDESIEELIEEGFEQPVMAAETLPELPTEVFEEPQVEITVGKAPPARKLETPDETPAIEKPEKFVVINVLALDEPFPGQGLLELLLESDMTFGEMNIFHRLDDEGNSQFSLANAVEPGTFDVATMDNFSTPGVTLFLRVHELPEPLTVLEELLNVAEAIAREFNGEVRDDTRSVMTPQTIEHCRQSIREFQYKHSA